MASEQDPTVADLVKTAYTLGGLDPDAVQAVRQILGATLPINPPLEQVEFMRVPEEPSPFAAEAATAAQTAFSASETMVRERHKTTSPAGANDELETPAVIEIMPAQARRPGRTTRIIAGIAIMSALSGGAAGVSYSGKPEQDKCSTPTTAQEVVGVYGGPFVKLRNQTRELVKPVFDFGDNRTWDDVADTLSAQRGYYIPPGRLARSNTALAAYNEDGSLQEELTKTGVACLKIPAPIAAGQILSDGKTSLNQYAARYGVKHEIMTQLNPESAHAPDEPVPAGFTLWTTKTPNTALVLRAWSADLLKEVGGDPDVLRAVLQANGVTSTKDLTPGQPGYFPYNQTPDMKDANIDPKAVTAAYADSYNYDLRKVNHEAEVPAPDANAEHTITLSKGQLDIINSLGLPPEKRDGLALILTNILAVQNGVTDINFQVMMAQAITESGYGTSDIAKQTNNYFGMKANYGWNGPTYIDPHDPSRTFRKYASVREGFQGYIDKIRSISTYDDARAAAATVDGYLDGLLNEPAYTPDAGYRATLKDVISKNRLAELLTIKPDDAPNTSNTGHITIEPNKWPAEQRVMWVNTSGFMTMPNGTQRRCTELTPAERIAVIEQQLNGMRLSPEGFEAWRKNIEDDRQAIQTGNNPNFASFRPGYNNHGSFADKNPSVDPMANAELFIWHYTATNGASTYRQGGADKPLDGLAFANSMGQRNLGIQYYTDKAGRTYRLTDAHVVHVKNRQQLTGDPNDNFQQHAYGMEILGSEQDDLTAKQYEAAVYAAAYFLIAGQKIQKTDSLADITKQVNYRIHGHREKNFQEAGDHSDFPGMVSGPLRDQLIRLLQQIGYGQK